MKIITSKLFDLNANLLAAITTGRLQPQLICYTFGIRSNNLLYLLPIIIIIIKFNMSRAS